MTGKTKPTLLAASRQETALPGMTEPVVPAKPWDRMTKGERLSRNVDLSLAFTRALLEAPIDFENIKLLGHQKDAALALISAQIRTDETRLRTTQERVGGLAEFYRRRGS